MAPAPLFRLSASRLGAAGPRSGQLSSTRSRPALARAPCRAAPRGARADAFGGVSRFFADAAPRRGEAPEAEEAPAVRVSASPAAQVALAADVASPAEVSALEASLGLGPFSSGATAAIAAMLERAERDVAQKTSAVPAARDVAQSRAQALRAAVETATARAEDTTARALDENQARAEALMRGFADSNAGVVIERLRTAAVLSAEEVTRAAFAGTQPRRAVITHAVAANERSNVTLQVREWQPSERDAAAALADEFRQPETTAEIAAADAPAPERGAYKRGQRQFKPLFRDYPYETADAA